MMKKRLALFIITTAAVVLPLLLSCPAVLTEDMMLNVRDETGPVITILSPQEGDACPKTLEVSGIVTDTSGEDGSAGSISSIAWEVLSADKSGNVEFDEDGNFSFSFSTEGLASTFVLKVRVTDWNGNSGELFVSLVLLEDNDIPSFRAVPDNNIVTLEWEDVPFTAGYDLYYSTNGTLPSESFGTRIQGVSSPCIVTGLDNGSMCVFRLCAVPEEGYAENWSGYERSIPLSVQTLAPVVMGANRQIELNWLEIPATDEFEIYKSTSKNGTFTNITGLHTGNSYVDTDVELGTYYYYKINPFFSDEIQSVAMGGASASFPSEPSFVSSIYIPQASYRKLDVAGDIACLLDEINDILLIIDCGNLESPVLRGTLDMSSGGTTDIYDLKIDGSYAYVCGGSSGLHIVDIRDKDEPSLLKTVPTTAATYTLELYAGYVMASAYNNGVDIIDISSAAAAFRVNTQASGYCRAMSRTDNYLYMFVDPGDDIWRYDITNPVSFIGGISRVSSYSSVNYVCGKGDYVNFMMYGDYYVMNLATGVETGPHMGAGFSGSEPALYGSNVYTASDATGFSVVNIYDQAAPALERVIDTPGTTWDIAIQDGYAYVADGSGFSVIEIKNPSAAEVFDSIDTDGGAQGLTAVEDYVYLADDGEGLKIIELESDGSFGNFSTFPAAEANEVAVTGNYAYLADGVEGLVVVDVSEPASPNGVTTEETQSGLTAITVYGGYAYALSRSPEMLCIYDLGNPASPAFVTSIMLTNTPFSITCAGNYAYAVGSDHPDGGGGSNLWIIDISEPASARIINTIPTNRYASGAAVSGNYVFVTETDISGPEPPCLTVVDIEDPESASIIASIDTPDNCGGIEIAGSYAYAGQRNEGMTIFDISDPYAPLISAAVYTSTSCSYVSVKGEYVYTGDGSAGVFAIDLLP
jgi:hypothetical protein